MPRIGTPNVNTSNAGATGATTGTGAASSTPSGHGSAVAPDTTVAGGLAHTAPAAQTSDPNKIVNELAQKAKAAGEKVVDIIKKPTAQSSVSATFRFGGEGRMLKPGEQLLLALPAHLQGRPVRHLILSHRQDHAHDTGTTPGQKWDANPGLTAVHLHASNLPEGQAWRHWNSPWGSSGSEGAKFAEARSSGDPEFELEFDWHSRGHQGATGGGYSNAPLLVDAARVKSVGKDPIFLHEVTVQVLPPKPDKYLQATFCEGTNIGDHETTKGRKFGGGQAHQGKFPGALELSGWGTGGAGAAKLPDGWSMKNGELHVKLTPGMRFTGVDIACGDSHPDGVHNKDGGWGTPGWSRLSIGVQRNGGPVDWFIDRQGVPPEGVLSGGPTELDFVAKSGDEVVFKASGDTTYVMALRIGLNEA